MGDETRLPPGYRQSFVTSITVLLSASILFFRFVVFEPASGNCTAWGFACGFFGGVSILMQALTLWRALQPEDEQIEIYKQTLKWFAGGVATFVASLVANTVANIIY